MPILKVSAAWSNKKIKCDFDKCGGKCCQTEKYWHPNSNGGICGNLSDTGCILEEHEKPITCLLYPFVINKNFSMILHGRALLGVCKNCYKQQDIPIIENMRGNIITLFGEEIYEQMYNAIVKHGRDFSFRPDINFWKELRYERKLEAAKIIEKRPYIIKDI